MRDGILTRIRPERELLLRKSRGFPSRELAGINVILVHGGCAHSQQVDYLLWGIHKLNT